MSIGIIIFDYNKSFGNHHSNEFFVVNVSITINISFSNHFINFIVCQFFSKIGHNVSQFSSWDKSVSISIEDFEGFNEFFFWILFLHLSSHQGQEFREIDCTVTIGVDFIDHILKFSFSWILSKWSHDCTQFLGGNCTITILVEKSEGFFEFSDLFFC